MTQPTPTGRELVTSGGEPTTSGGWRNASGKIRTVLRTRSTQVAAVVVALGLFAGGVQASGASFNDMLRIGVNASTGTLDINVDGNQGNPDPYVLETGPFKPGDTVTKTVEVRNTGNLPAVVTGMITSTGPDQLGTQMDASLSAAPADAAPVTAAGKATGLQVGEFVVPGGAAVPLTWTLSLPSSIGNDWQAKTDTLVLTLDAVQE